MTVPASAAESEYDLVTPTGTLGGTLSLPAPSATRVALIVAGSGPTDRDGNNPAGVASAPYRRLAAALAQAGIASVRYDKRGIGGSSAAITSEQNLTFDILIADVVAWLAKLRADGRFHTIAVVGHSEGSLLGMIAATPARANAYVSVSGAGFPAAQILRRQLAPRLAQAPALLAASDRIIDSLSAGKTVADVPSELAGLYRPSVQPYLISWFRYDPRIEIAKSAAPVAIVQGTTDLQVSVDDARALAAARKDAQLVVVSNMTHMLTDDASTDEQQQAASVYANASLPIDATLIQTIVRTIPTG